MNVAAPTLSKPGKHGTLHLFAAHYHDDEGTPSTWRCWAYDADHAYERAVEYLCDPDTMWADSRGVVNVTRVRA